MRSVIVALAVTLLPSWLGGQQSFNWDWSRAHESVLDLSPFLDAPAGKGGFVRNGGESVPHLVANVTNDFCVITLTALDDQPIAQAKRLLLVATTGAAQNTGQQFAEDGKTLAEWGKGPVLIEPVSGTVTLRGLPDAKSIHATALTSEGRPAGAPILVTRAEAGWRLKLGEPATTWWLLEVTR
jgi:hypothetical protein